MEDELSKAFMEFEEFYTEGIIHRNILVEFACILHPNTFPKKANPFSGVWMCFQCLDLFQCLEVYL